MDFQIIKTAIQSAFENDKDNAEVIKFSHEMDMMLPGIKRIVAKVLSEFVENGIWFEDVKFIGVAVGDIMMMAATIKKFTGGQKRQFVKDTIWLIYQAIDGYPDGDSNNLNVPLLFGSLEKGFERRALDFAVDMAVKGLYPWLRRMNKV